MNRVNRILIILSVLYTKHAYCNKENIQNAEKIDYPSNNTVMIELSTLDSEGNLNGRTTDYPIFSEKDNFGKKLLSRNIIHILVLYLFVQEM